MQRRVGGTRARVRATRRADAQTLVLVAVLVAIGVISANTATSAPPAGRALAAVTGSTQDWSSSRDLHSVQVPATVSPTTPHSAPAPRPAAQPQAASRVGPAPPRQPAPPPPPPADSGSAASAVFAAINQSRAAAGLPALRWSSGLSRSAHLHNLAMAAADQLSHQVSGEASLGTRVSEQGVPWSWVGENIGESPWLTTAGALGLEQLMMGDSSHRQNILTTSGTMVGVDVVFDTGHHTLWLTEDFAN